MKKPQYRLRKHGEVKKDSTLAKKQGRLGPLTLETREWMLAQIIHETGNYRLSFPWQRESKEATYSRMDSRLRENDGRFSHLMNNAG